jgi:hypothetical protein
MSQYSIKLGVFNALNYAAAYGPAGCRGAIFSVRWIVVRGSNIMLKRTISAVFTLNFFLFFSATAHFFYLEQLRKAGRSVLLWADYHESEQKENQNRAAQQAFFTQMLAKTKSVAIVEDPLGLVNKELYAHPFTYNPNDFIVPREQIEKLDQAQSPLFGLASLAYLQGNERLNIETRAPFQASMREQHEEGRYISGHQVLIAQMNTASAIAGFDDGKICNAYYHKKLNSFLEQQEALDDFFQLVDDKEKSLKELLNDRNFILKASGALKKVAACAQTTIPDSLVEQWAFIEDLLYASDTALTDCLAVHAVNLYEDKKSIFVAAGGKHIKAVRKNLVKQGYESKILAGKQYHNFFTAKQTPLMLEEPQAIKAPN